MSRTTDCRLSGWIMNSNIFVEEVKFSDLIEEKGTISFVIYVILKGIICLTNGYYAELTDGLVRQIHRQLGKCSRGQQHIKETIWYFGYSGILDGAKLENNILTSLDIQKEWLFAKTRKRAKINVDNLEHWLLVDTLPTPTDNNCSNNNDNCSNNSNNCNNYEDNCTLYKTQQDTTRELVYINTNNNYSENFDTAEKYTKEKVLSIIYSKHERLKDIINHQEYSENAIMYALYWANACNDIRYMNYTIDIDNVSLNKDFFVNCLYTAEASEILKIFKACYDNQSNVLESNEWYFRGILTKKYRKLAKEYQKRFQRGSQ